MESKLFFSCILGQESTTDCSNSRRYWKSIGREIEPIASSFFPTRIAANAAIFATSRKQWQRCCCSSYWGHWAWNWGSRFQPCTIASSNAATANLLIASSSKWLLKLYIPSSIKTWLIQLSHMLPPNIRGAYFESLVSDQLFSVVLAAYK